MRKGNITFNLYRKKISSWLYEITDFASKWNILRLIQYKAQDLNFVFEHKIIIGLYVFYKTY